MGPRDRLDPGVRSQFLVDVSQVVANRLGRDREVPRNLLGGLIGGDELEDLALARRQFADPA